MLSTVGRDSGTISSSESKESRYLRHREAILIIKTDEIEGIWIKINIKNKVEEDRLIYINQN